MDGQKGSHGLFLDEEHDYYVCGVNERANKTVSWLLVWERKPGFRYLSLVNKLRKVVQITVKVEDVSSHEKGEKVVSEVDWELLILSKLQWNIAAVTGFDYIDHILDRVPWGMENPLIRRHASTLVGICYTGRNLTYCFATAHLSFPRKSAHSWINRKSMLRREGQKEREACIL
ncbi:hypothetical protein RUM43_006065 [Polyplax serrata]|uniref:Uncharacterized protein n=1 Tax=Polyplax serrata TaxID=468196 RepID=A0AAN8RV49_POLSC